MVETRKDLGLFRHSLLGLGGNAHFGVFHIASNIIIVKGLFLSSAWRVLHSAQQTVTVATSG